jgi:BirA family biotin operon repressor/biotin-[acetyl-CoA-carboxylase] ligase
METRQEGFPPLVTPWPGAFVSVKERTTSTMDDALQLARAGCPSGTVAAAQYQEKGRGRLPGRSWLSAPGESLLATVILRVSDLGYSLAELPLRAGLAMAAGIEDAAGIPVEIKWPNDIVSGRGAPAAGRKLAGLLCEAHGDAALVGFGVNIAQVSFPRQIALTACSLFQVCGRAVSTGVLLSAILQRLKSAPADGEWQERLSERLHRRGESVRVSLLGTGRILEGILRGLDEKGRLVLEVSGGRMETVAQGELLTFP